MPLSLPTSRTIRSGLAICAVVVGGAFLVGNTAIGASQQPASQQAKAKTKPMAELHLSATLKPAPKAKQIIVTLRNTGSKSAFNLTTTVKLPKGITMVRLPSIKGIGFVNGTVTWSRSNLKPGEHVTVTIVIGKSSKGTATITSAGVMPHTGTVSVRLKL